MFDVRNQFSRTASMFLWLITNKQRQSVAADGKNKKWLFSHVTTASI